MANITPDNADAANERSGADAGWRVLFAFERRWPRATHRERWV